VSLGSIAALVVLGLVLGNLVWSSATQQRPALPPGSVSGAEAASSDLQTAPVSGSYETGITPEPTLESPTVAAEPEPPVPPKPTGSPDPMPKTPLDSPEPEEIVPAAPTVVAVAREATLETVRASGALPHENPAVAAAPKEAAPETQVMGAKAPKVQIGTHPTVLGLKSAVAWLEQSGLIRLVSTLASPASLRAESKGGSVGTAPLGSTDSNAGRQPVDGSGAPGVVTPIIDLPAEVNVAAGTEAKLHIRVMGRDTEKPVQLEFQGLPRGMSAAGLTIPAARDSADVVLSASAELPPGLGEVKVAFTTGSERGEATTRVRVLPPPPATVAFQRGLAALYRGSCGRAIAEFAEVIRLDPNSSRARFYRGMSYALAGRSREALADYTAAIQLRPDHPDAYLDRARVYLDLGEKSLALSDYAEAIRLRPDAKAYLARGSLHHEMGSYDQAVADCDRALRLRPGDSQAFYLRGLTRYHSGDNARAIADFTEVLRLDPKDAGAYRTRGDAYARLGKSAEAGSDHEAFERLNRPPAEGASNQPGVVTGEGGPGAGRGQSP
jgi:tetratricopeptide (TPR) repeat protein